MNKSIIFMRHCEPQMQAGADGERHLTEKGIMQAKQQGERIRELNLTPDLIFCSPSTRTRETLRNLGFTKGITGQTEFLIELQKGPEGAWEDHLLALPESAATLLVIGHCPSIDAMVYRFTGEVPPPMQVGTFVVVEFSSDRWEEVYEGRCSGKVAENSTSE